MTIPVYQIDAFTDAVFGGNPAAVCPLTAWLPDATLLAIAAENNLAETAFFVPAEAGRFHLRWFTPDLEMDLCGHATLATAHALWHHLDYRGDVVTFDSQSGPLTVTNTDQLYTLDFPARPPQPAALPDALRRGLGTEPLEVWKARDYLLVVADEATVRQLRPDRALLDTFDLGPGGIIVTAPGDASSGGEADFVSRFFTPQSTIFEDPVTGSAHCTLVPYWAARLGRNDLLAWQVSARGGVLHCQHAGERVRLGGRAVTFMAGTIYV